MSVALRTDREGGHATLVPTGSFDLAHATEVTQAVSNAEASLNGRRSVEVDLAQLDRIYGTGAVLLARFLGRLDTDGQHAFPSSFTNPGQIPVTLNDTPEPGSELHPKR